MQIYQELKLNNGILRGYLHQPDVSEKVPLVVMYHGFTGCKEENNFLFTQFSRYLCAHNVASLRFDFLGSGESDQEFSYMTFSKEVFEANAILDYAKKLPFVSKLIVMGLSMGGAIATQVAKTRFSEIDQLILWAPAGIMSKLVESNERYPMIENGNYDLGGLELSQDFVQDIIQQDLWKDIALFNKKVSIHHGADDQAIPLSVSEKYKLIYPNATLHTYKNANHTFTNIESRKALFLNNLKFISE